MQKIVFSLAGLANILIAVAHIVCLLWADRMFQLTGISPEMQRWAEVNPVIPYLITVAVAVVFFVFGLYAFSAAGVIKPLPLLKPLVIIITALYMLRGFGGLIIGNDSTLPVIYSVGALLIGALFLIGTESKWRRNTV